MATRLLIFCFCFTGENGERNGRSHGFSVQFQNQGGGHHGAFCKGNMLSPHSSKDSQATEPQCAVPFSWGFSFLWLTKGDGTYILAGKNKER